MHILDEKRFFNTHKIFQVAIKKSVTPGLVVGFWKKGFSDQFFAKSFGVRSVIPETLSLNIDTFYDIASLTKIFVVLPLIYLAVCKKWMTLEDMVLPQYGITVHHLLSHTSGFAPHQKFWKAFDDHFQKPLWDVPLGERKALMQRLLLAQTPHVGPGMAYASSDVGYLHSGFFLEHLLKQSLDVLFDQWIAKPLGLGMYFQPIIKAPEENKKSNVAATEQCAWRKCVLLNQVHDQNAWAMGGVAGHAGLFANIEQVLHFAKQFLNHWMKEEAFKPFLKRPPYASFGHTYGGFCRPDHVHSTVGSFLSPTHSVGHLGFTGTSLWMDPEQGLAVCLLSNRIHPTVNGGEGIKKLRIAMHNALCQDIQRLEKEA